MPIELQSLSVWGGRAGAAAGIISRRSALRWWIMRGAVRAFLVTLSAAGILGATAATAGSVP
ncbi:hypothetical protein, partial [Nocardia wallacei]|uniref:hypothetical protein n=1 Tax=Nocardia wallacei TaxID=480035 RepID=UPI002454431A